MTCFDVKVSSSGLWYKIYKWKYILTYLLLEKLASSQLVKKFPHFMEPKCSLPHLQAPATCLYPQPDQTSQKEIYTTVIMFKTEITILLVKIHVAMPIKLYKINKCKS